MRLSTLHEAQYAGSKDTRLLARVFNEVKKREPSAVINDIARWIAKVQSEHFKEDWTHEDFADLLLKGLPALLDNPKQLDKDLHTYVDSTNWENDSESVESLADWIAHFVRTGKHQ